MNISNKFYEATVIDINDTQLSGIVSVRVDELMSSQNSHIGENINYKKGTTGQHVILARPANKYYDGKADKYKIPSGKYSSPLKNERIVVFFLNQDMNKCYYIPDMSIRGVGENIKGFNLDIADLNDFMEISRRPYMKVQEFYNRNIIGFNNNPDQQHFFFKFDNGSELHFKSPNDNKSISSSKTDASEWEVVIKRYDSFYQNKIKQSTTQDSSSVEISAHKEKPENHPSDYKIPIDSIDDIKSSNIINVEAGSALNNRNVGYALDKRRSTSFNSTASSNQNNTSNIENYKFDDLTSSSTRDISKVINKDGMYDSDTKYNINNVKDESILFTNLINSGNGLVNIIKMITFKIMSTLNITSKKEVLVNKGGILTTKTDTITNIDDKNNIDVSDSLYNNINKDGSMCIKTSSKSYKSNSNKFIVGKSTKINTDNENSSKLTMISDEHESSVYFGISREISELSGDVSTERSFRSSSVKQFSRNPADPNRSLDLDPLFVRGHEVESFVEDGIATTQLKSIKKSSMGSHIPTMGIVNHIKYVEDGTSSKIEVDLKGTDKTAGVKLVISTDDSGSFVLEVPRGDVKIKSKSGNISASTKSGNVNVAGENITVKASSSLDLLGGDLLTMEAKTINISATNDLDMKSAMFTLDGTGTIKGSNISVDSRLISLGGGASNALLKSNLFIAWANTHMHTAPSGPTTPPIRPLSPSVLSNNVFNK